MCSKVTPSSQKFCWAGKTTIVMLQFTLYFRTLVSLLVSLSWLWTYGSCAYGWEGLGLGGRTEVQWGESGFVVQWHSPIQQTCLQPLKGEQSIWCWYWTWHISTKAHLSTCTDCGLIHHNRPKNRDEAKFSPATLLYYKCVCLRLNGQYSE